MILGAGNITGMPLSLRVWNPSFGLVDQLWNVVFWRPFVFSILAWVVFLSAHWKPNEYCIHSGMEIKAAFEMTSGFLNLHLYEALRSHILRFVLLC